MNNEYRKVVPDDVFFKDAFHLDILSFDLAQIDDYAFRVRHHLSAGTGVKRVCAAALEGEWDRLEISANNLDACGERSCRLLARRNKQNADDNNQWQRGDSPHRERG